MPLSRKIQLFLVAIFSLFTLCAHGETPVSGSQSGTWVKAGSPYILTGSIIVEAGSTLTIEPGVEVRSMAIYDQMVVNGTLIAKGTLIDSIRFIGFANDKTAGGNIVFASESVNSVLKYVAIDHFGYYYQGAISSNTASLSISDAVMRNSGNIAIDITGNAGSQFVIHNTQFFGSAGIGIKIGTSQSPQISAVKFSTTPFPIKAYPSSLGGITGCDNIAVYLDNETSPQSSTIPKVGIGSYYVIPQNFVVSKNTTLTIRPGVEIRSYSYQDRIDVLGTLIARGTVTDSVRFIGFPNPVNTYSERGGTINFAEESSNSVLQYVAIDNWGDSYYAIALSSYTATLSITNSAVRNVKTTAISIGQNAGSGVIINNIRIQHVGEVGIDIQSGQSPVLSDVEFFATTKPIQTGFSGTAGLAGLNNIGIYLTNDYLTGAGVLPKPGNGSYYVLQGGFTISQGAKLTISPGVSIKSYNYSDRITVAGTLIAKGTATDSIRFIGYPDPNYTYSQAGGNLYFDATSENSEMQYVSMDNWGDINNYGIALITRAASLSVTHSSIRNSGRVAVYIESNATNKVIFSDNSIVNARDGGISVGQSVSPVLSNLNISGTPKPVVTYISSASGITDLNNTAIYLNNESLPANTVLPKAGTGSYYVLDAGFTIPAGITLTISPGVTIRSYNYSDRITVAGTLIAKGTATDSIRFIGYPDPNYTYSQAGGNLLFDATSENSELQYVAIDNWGDVNNYGIAIITRAASLSVTHSSIRNSGRVAVYIESNATNKVIFSDNSIVNARDGGISVGQSVSPVLSNLNISGTPKPVVTYISSASGITNLKNIAVYLNSEYLGGNDTLPRPGAGSYYVMLGAYTISPGAKLTVSPGVEVRSYDYSDRFVVQGTLIAKGTATDSIKFLGFKNINNPGVTNGGYISFESGSHDSELQYIFMDKWGDRNYYGHSIDVDAAGVNISNAVVQNSGSVGVYFRSGAGAGAVLTKSTITGTDVGVDILSSAKPQISALKFASNEKDIQAYPSSADGIKDCDNVNVYLRQETIYKADTLTKPGKNSSYILQGGFTVAEDVDFTIAPGVTINSQNIYDYIRVYGTLKAQGTAADSVKFIGMPGEDAPLTNKGGNISFEQSSKNSELNFTSIYNWGDSQYYGTAVSVNSSSVTINNSNVRFSGDIGINIGHAITPVLSEVSFAANPRDVVVYPSGLAAVSNLKNAGIYLNQETISTALSIPKPGPGSYYVLQGGFTIPQSVAVSIAPGVEIRSRKYYDQISVSGTLTAIGTPAEPIKFKGFADFDNPQFTHCGNLVFQSASTNSVLKNVIVDNWGDKGYYLSAININSSSVTISNSSVTNSGETGITVADNVSPSITQMDFVNNPADILASITSCGGILNNKNALIAINSGSIYANALLPYPGENSHYRLRGSVNILQNYVLNIEAGVVIDYGDYGDITISGTLNAIGTKASPIKFYKSGSNEAYAFNRLYFYNTSTVALNFVEIDKLGNSNYFSQPSVIVYTPNFSASNISISNSPNDGLYFAANAKPVITNSSFFNNKIGIHVGLGSPVITNSNIYGNTDYGILNDTYYDSADTVDARNNYWGTPTGPFHATVNPEGKGNQVSDRVLIDPYRSKPSVEDNDIGITAIVAPITDCNHTAADTVKVRIFNFGNLPQQNFSVAYNIKGVVVSETVSGISLLPGKYIDYSFSKTVDLSATGMYAITAYTLLADGRKENDTLHITIEHLPELLAPANLLPGPGAQNLDIPVTLSWGAVNGATAYDVYLWKDGDAEPLQPVVANTEQITALVNGILIYGNKYNWRVVARRAGCRAASTTSTFSIRQLPDLIVQSVNVPVKANTETPIEVSWKVKNQGSGSTAATRWYDVAYLADQPNLASASQIYSIATPSNFSALNAGQNYETEKLSFMVPQGIQGVYYVIVQTNVSRQVTETQFNNNELASAPINITLTPPPDLQVTALTVSPLTIFSGDTATITYTVKNEGKGPTTAPYWYDQAVLSNEAGVVQNSDAVLMGNYHNELLAAGNSYTFSQKVKLPNHISGTYYVNLTIDRFSQVFEYDKEANNITSTLALTVITRPSPNLVVSSLSLAQDSAANNQPINLRWTVNNDGAVDAAGNWWDEVYLSTSPVLNSGSLRSIGGYSREPVLSSLDSYQRSAAVTIPYDLQEGTYYLYVKADSYNYIDEGNDEGDNFSAASSPIRIVNPDLVPASLTVPATANSEEKITIQWAVKNNSRATVYDANWTDRLYLSADETLDVNTDVLLADIQVNNLMAPGGSYQKQTGVSLPVGVSGKYYILLVTNANGGLYEKNRNNNVISSPININLSPWPDLRVASVSTAATDTAGTILSAKYLVTNTGGGAIDQKRWTDNIYLSPSDNVNDAGLIFLGSVAQNRSLGAGETFTQQLRLQLPVNLSTGNYYLVVKSNYDKGVFENNSIANNALAGGVIQIISQLPIDLAVVSGEPISMVITAGQQASVTWTVRNTSANATIVSGWRDAIYLSNNAVFDSGDKLLTLVNINQPLAAGTSYTQMASVIIPQDAGSSIYLLVVTDKDNLNNDPNLGNNNLPLSKGSGGPVEIVVPPPPDLAPASFTVSNQGTASQPLDVSFVIKNNGTGSTAANAWTDHIYLSTSTNINDGTLLAVFPHSGTLAAGASYEVKSSVLLPAGSSGNYLLLLKTDAANNVYEKDRENNNQASAGLFIKQQQPSDLVVKNISIPPGTRFAGDTLTVNWTLVNNGANIGQGYLKEAVYLSKDTLLDAGDVLFGTLDNYIYLPPATSAGHSLNKPITGLSLGEYYVLVKTDVQNNILEQNDDNNLSASVTKMAVSVKELQLNIQAGNVLTKTTPLYYRFEVPATLAGETLSIKLLGDSVNNAVNRIFIRKDSIPTPNRFDFTANLPFKANQELVVPALKTGTYYITVLGTDVATEQQTISLLAKIIPFGITAVDASKGGNTGQVTVKLTGARFEEGMVVKLTGPSTYVASLVYYVDATKMFVTFDLNKAPVGKYTVVAEKAGVPPVQLTNGFEVVTGTPGGSAGASQLFSCKIQNIGFDEAVEVNVIHPESVRRNQKFKMTIAYVNGGNVDIPVQARVLLSLEGAPLSFTPDFAKELKELFLEFKEEDGPPGILRAGSSGFINVYTYSIAPMSFEITQ